MVVQVWEILTACENARVGRPCGLEHAPDDTLRTHLVYEACYVPPTSQNFQTIMAFCDRGRLIDYNFFIFHKDLITCGVTMIQDNLGITSPRSSLDVVRSRLGTATGHCVQPFRSVEMRDAAMLGSPQNSSWSMARRPPPSENLRSHRVKPLELDLSKTASQSHHTTHGGLAISVVGPPHTMRRGLAMPATGLHVTYQQTEKSLAPSFNNAPHREAYPKVLRSPPCYHAAPATVVCCKQSHVQTGDNHRPPPWLQLSITLSACHAMELGKRRQKAAPSLIQNLDEVFTQGAPYSKVVVSSKMTPPAGKTTT
ncbi:hypothetical protein HU200_018679 [Digitaria exilis]|uniref:Uncharacterized protein n=1 Tax=Digitaria exilis TaxID=1010633 RepID=A0A835KIX5_9POAL|nr:hypothetical protein HU200_018679 [Digitaria exilis]